MRLDKFVAKASDIPRSKAKKLITSGLVTVDNEQCKSVGLIVSDQHSVSLSGKPLSYRQQRYILLNKPRGYICSRKDEQYPSALNLLGMTNLAKLHFAGRLDVDTSGLVLISDDGQWTHRVTSPRHKQPKTYIVEVTTPLSDEQRQQLEKGVLLKDSDKLTKTAVVSVIDNDRISLTITEGRYHQVKRMLAAVNNHVTGLHRESIGHLKVDEELSSGKWRYLTEQEITGF
jgi:16S rRNA pseudouridine516 synthase